ncbi:MAG: GNAT family N-acetyltransferase [Pikeienuella sp.]
MLFPDEIETERLTLRIPRASDAGPVGLYAGEARVAMTTASIPHPYPPGGAEAFVAKAIEDRAEDPVWVMDGQKSERPEFIGCIALHKRPNCLDLGYWVAPPFWSMGFATEASSAIVDAAFAGGCNRMTASHFEGNPASAIVISRLGFVEIERKEVFGTAAGRLMPVRKYELTQERLIAARAASA